MVMLLNPDDYIDGKLSVNDEASADKVCGMIQEMKDFVIAMCHVHHQDKARYFLAQITWASMQIDQHEHKGQERLIKDLKARISFWEKSKLR